MNPRIHIKLVVVAAAVLLVGAAVALADISPNPVKFGGAGIKKVLVTNTGNREALYRVSVVPAGAPFKVPNARDCSHVQPGGRCILKVSYSPSGAAEDRATLRVEASGEPLQQADLIGHPGSGGGGGGGGTGSGPNCTMTAARNQKLVNGGKKKPYQVALLQSEDGTVSASAGGKVKSGKRISLNSARSAATAGNGVVLKLKLGKASTKRIRSELAAGRKPKMVLRGQCQGTDGVTVETATIHFKSGKGKTLIADARTK